MSIALAIAIYIVVWWITLFAVLPFGVRTQGEAGTVVDGTPASAPQTFPIGRVVVINTLVSGVIYAAVFLLLRNPTMATMVDRWIGIELFGG
ncbi:MAG: DUF1467 family protein [Hyphomicrobiaceae bacterium]|nr:DUF1467 family protein [Hyphomicrobiaceae bacterium]